ncbi:nitrate regulatory protein [Candidatus Symbiopectobacterium sp. NZEC135]|uniref:nitrate regulatory protein n=1 Tax=Candidatus Symbiopectobacterium sp. NZEC135 TaxID=2820471 RepID=UPI00222739EE|nr:nitrate regulatory protein [Candidatus Symbiopectobacterium sp. NZEC135]MCW2480102.1 nitrate- and nitrite sensing domain-containing protein [Candidatus Symbiopectobacterium sp. NZEC135]
MVANPETTLQFLMTSRQCELNSLRCLLQSGELVGKISQLVHMLQRERGTSNLFLCAQESVAPEALRLREQDVGLAQAQVMAHLLQLEQRTDLLPQASRLFSRAASVVYSLSLLPVLRHKLRQRMLPQPDVMTAFNDIIRHLLALVFEVSDTAAEPGIARALVAMFSFMQGKEFAGQERALGAAAFATGAFTPDRQQALLDLIERQERCFDTFVDFADDENKAHWQQLGTDREFERLRRIACTRMAAGALNAGESMRWFALATERIDAMKRLEDALEQTLMALCQQRITAAEAACRDQAVSVEHLLEQQQDHAHGYSVFMPGEEMVSSQTAAQWISSDGVCPQLGRSLLSLVQTQSRRLQRLDSELTEMRASLTERKQIDRAKGMLMQHRGMTEEEAYKTLRSLAMSQNKKLVEIATAMLAVADVFQSPP